MNFPALLHKEIIIDNKLASARQNEIVLIIPLKLSPIRNLHTISEYTNEIKSESNTLRFFM